MHSLRISVGGLPVLASMTKAKKGSGAAAFFGCIACLGVVICLIFLGDRHIWKLEET